MSRTPNNPHGPPEISLLDSTTQHETCLTTTVVFLAGTHKTNFPRKKQSTHRRISITRRNNSHAAPYRAFKAQSRSSGAHKRLPTKRATPCCWEMSSPMAASMVTAASEGHQLCNHHCLRNLLHALSVAERIFPEFTFFLADAVHVALRDHLPEPLLLRQLGGIATEEPRNGRHHADLDETLLARNLRTLEILKNSYELFRIHMISCEFFKIIKTSFDLSAQFQRTPGIL